MKKSEFKNGATGLVWEWINNQDLQGQNAQLRVNPVYLYVDFLTEKEFLQSLALAQEAIENAAYAHDAAQYEAADNSAAQNPDYYPMRSLVKKDEDGKTVPDPDAIEKVASNYTFEGE